MVFHFCLFSLYWGLDPGKNAFEVAPFAYPPEKENSFPPCLPEDSNTKLTRISQEKKKLLIIQKLFSNPAALQQKVLLARLKKYHNAALQALLSLRQTKDHAL